MSVYVDPAVWRFGRMIMCHLTADTHEELIDMADRIGVARKWIQYPGTWKEHFDVCKSKRALAIALGAVELSMREASQRIAVRQANARAARGRLEHVDREPVTPTLDPHDACAHESDRNLLLRRETEL